MAIKCSVTRCDYQKDGVCTTTPNIEDESFNVQMSDDIVGESFPVCHSIETNRKYREYVEARYKEIQEENKKRFKQ